MIRRLWRVAQIIGVAAVVYFLGRSLGHNWSAIRASRGLIELDGAALAASAGITLATYAMLVSAWRAVLLGWKQRLAYPRAAAIWSLSNLARYIPGRVWQIAGMAAMARREGVSGWAAAGSAVVVQLLAIATGGLITGTFAPHAGRPELVAATALAAALVVTALAWPPATHRIGALLRRLTGKDLRLEPVALGPLLLSAAVTTLAWVAYGVAFYFFVQGLLGAPLLSLADAIGTFTASYLVGLILVFTPGGLGVRESALYILLKGPLGPGAAVAVSIGSRILMTATELLAAAITAPLARGGLATVAEDR